jgi:hypothetical protein
VARAISSATITKSPPMSGIVGPQTNEERPATIAREIPQRVRTNEADWRCQKHVSATSKLRTPHSTCITVSTFWPIVRERGNWRNPPESAFQASKMRNSKVHAKKPRRTTGRRLNGSSLWWPNGLRYPQVGGRGLCLGVEITRSQKTA